MQTIVINARFLTQKITGTQRYAVEVSKILSELNINTIFVSPNNVINEDIAYKLNFQKIGKFTGHLWEQFDLPFFLKKIGNPLLVNFVNTAPLFYKNQVVTIHDLAFLRHPEWFSKKFYLFYKFLIPKVAHSALKVITVSNFSKKEIISLLKIPEKKIEVVYGAVNKKFKPFYGEKENYILTVASLDPRKNFRNLILAFTKLKLRDYKLIIVGRKNRIFSNKELNFLITKISNIEFTGYISEEELIKLYQKAKLFIYPSLYEGFGLPPLEAMACGCPVVVSNVASLPEVCGDAAYYVDPYDVENIAEGMYKVLTDKVLRESLIKKGLERVKQFSWEKTAREILKVIESLL